LTIAVTNTKTKQTKNYDLLKGNNAYKVNLEGLKAGSYAFTVKELNSKTTYSSSFEILALISKSNSLIRCREIDSISCANTRKNLFSKSG
jgi:hypothetical protein